MPSLFLSAAKPNEFRYMRSRLIDRLLDTEPFNAGKWQQLDVSESSAHDTYEIQQLTLFYPMPNTMMAAVKDIGPDLPWAEGHFQERVAGEATNPGVWHDRWPYHAGQVQLHQNGGRYDHNYMERMWPKDLEDELGYTDRPWSGYRFEVGDLRDVVTMLVDDPSTRQAYLPIWFPEDTGAISGQRVPCSLGYHFMIREGKLHLSYYLRSCEAYRHFTNDVYMAVRLAQWVADEVAISRRMKGAENAAQTLSMGDLHMTVASFHGFVGDTEQLEALIG